MTTKSENEKEEQVDREKRVLPPVFRCLAEERKHSVDREQKNSVQQKKDKQLFRIPMYKLRFAELAAHTTVLYSPVVQRALCCGRR